MPKTATKQLLTPKPVTEVPAVNGTAWLAELMLKRKAQTTNVFLIETFDFKRFDQFVQFAIPKADDKSPVDGKDEKVTVVELDLQRGIAQTVNRQRDEKGRIKRTEFRTEGALSLIASFDQKMRTSRFWLLTRYVAMRTHADGIVDQLLAWSHDNEVYGHQSTVLIFTSDASLFDEKVRRLFYTIQVPPSSDHERQAIVEATLEQFKKGGMPLQVSGQDVYQVVKSGAGLTLHDMESATIESIYTNRALVPETYTTKKVAILKGFGIEYIEPTRGFESVGGYNMLKDHVRERIINLLRNPTKALAYGLRPPRGILLVGLPGCGKTWISKALSKEIGLPMLKITPADFLRGIVGESESRVKYVTQLIESLSPAIVFVDEFDQMAMRRDQQVSGDSGVSRRVQNMLLDWLGDEKRKSILVGATNFLQLDPAFIRPGRIDDIVLMLPPDTQARKEILTILLRDKPTAINDAELTKIAGETRGWTGAELEKMVQTAATLAYNAESKLNIDCLFGAVKRSEVNFNERRKAVANMVDAMRQLDNVDLAFLQDSVKEWEDSEALDRTEAAVREIVPDSDVRVM